MTKRFVRTLSRTVDNAVLLTLLVALLFASYALWDNHNFLRSAGADNYSAYKPTEEEGQKTFEELRAINPDVIGWLTIYDTTIDYPVLRSPHSNDDYLSKNAEGEWSGPGSLFLEHKNKADFSDFSTIIFGHHMAGPAMFGQLDSFLDRDFFQEHEFANLFFSETGLQKQADGTYEFTDYQGKNHGVHIFAMIQADGFDRAVYRVPLTTTDEKQALLNTIADYAIHVRNLDMHEVRQLGKAGSPKPIKNASVSPDFFGVTTDDTIVLMSTCSAEITNGRFVLCGKLLDEEVENPFPEEEEEPRTVFGIDIDSVFDAVFKLSVKNWILLLIFLIVLLGLLYYAERYRLKKKRERKHKGENANDQNQEVF